MDINWSFWFWVWFVFNAVVAWIEITYVIVPALHALCKWTDSHTRAFVAALDRIDAAEAKITALEEKIQTLEETCRPESKVRPVPPITREAQSESIGP